MTHDSQCIERRLKQISKTKVETKSRNSKADIFKPTNQKTNTTGKSQKTLKYLFKLFFLHWFSIGFLHGPSNRINTPHKTRRTICEDFSLENFQICWTNYWIYVNNFDKKIPKENLNTLHCRISTTCLFTEQCSVIYYKFLKTRWQTLSTEFKFENFLFLLQARRLLEFIKILNKVHYLIKLFDHI